MILVRAAVRADALLGNLTHSDSAQPNQYRQRQIAPPNWTAKLARLVARFGAASARRSSAQSLCLANRCRRRRRGCSETRPRVTPRHRSQRPRYSLRYSALRCAALHCAPLRSTTQKQHHTTLALSRRLCFCCCITSPRSWVRSTRNRCSTSTSSSIPASPPSPTRICCASLSPARELATVRQGTLPPNTALFHHHPDPVTLASNRPAIALSPFVLVSAALGAQPCIRLQSILLLVLYSSCSGLCPCSSPSFSSGFSAFVSVAAAAAAAPSSSSCPLAVCPLHILLVPYRQSSHSASGIRSSRSTPATSSSSFFSDSSTSVTQRSLASTRCIFTPLPYLTPLHARSLHLQSAILDPGQDAVEAEALQNFHSCAFALAFPNWLRRRPLYLSLPPAHCTTIARAFMFDHQQSSTSVFWLDPHPQPHPRSPSACNIRVTIHTKTMPAPLTATPTATANTP